MSTRLTRRGWALLGVVCLGVALSYGLGTRTLGAVVVPSAVALVAAAARAWRVPTPGASRLLPDDAPAGSTGEVTVRFDVPAPVPATAHDGLPEGLAGDSRVSAVVGAEPVRYRVEYRERGRQRVGPVEVRTTDVLGLVETRRTVPGRDGLVVYPPIRDLPPATVGVVRASVVDDRTGQRDEFEGIREYVRGDPLRDVHWKSTAKRDALIVKEFVGSRPRAEVVLVATGAPGAGDAMAEAAATLGDAVLREGVPVTLVTADGSLTVRPARREALLDALATAEPGAVGGTEGADVLVDARDAETRVRIGDVETTFDRLLAGDPVGEGTTGEGGTEVPA